MLDGVEVFTSLSIGIATSDARDVAPEDILRDADMAMYRAKLQGKGRVTNTLNEVGSLEGFAPSRVVRLGLRIRF